MTDAFTDELFAPTRFEAARMVFPVSRLVCDVERFPEDADEPTDGQPLREHLTAADRARLIDTWYHPHHQKLTASVDQLIVDGRDCIIVDCHSFSSRPLPHEPDQDPARPDICIGTDAWHTPARLRDELVAAASTAGLSVLVDRPFAGALVPATHYRREPKVLAVMIEVNRRLYMNEETGEQLPRFGEIRQAVSEMVAAVGRFPQ